MNFLILQWNSKVFQNANDTTTNKDDDNNDDNNDDDDDNTYIYKGINESIMKPKSIPQMSLTW